MKHSWNPSDMHAQRTKEWLVGTTDRARTHKYVHLCMRIRICVDMKTSKALFLYLHSYFTTRAHEDYI
jgi:hypothetical protein